MAQLDQTVRQTRRALQTLAGPRLEPAAPDQPCGAGVPAVEVPEAGHEDKRAEHHD